MPLSVSLSRYGEVGVALIITVLITKSFARTQLYSVATAYAAVDNDQRCLILFEQVLSHSGETRKHVRKCDHIRRAYQSQNDVSLATFHNDNREECTTKPDPEKTSVT